ncbi:hypothetical protein [Marininema halotolerans]|uniref:hypothetical protein n=1 Tax=Marininema halotolerans TaxID=1155944 RepID=UPI000B88EBC3|nr:hypothetical protein [Marininema halotolerans]
MSGEQSFAGMIKDKVLAVINGEACPHASGHSSSSSNIPSKNPSTFTNSHTRNHVHNGEISEDAQSAYYGKRYGN